MEGIQTLPEEKAPEEEPVEEPQRKGEEWRNFLDDQFGAMIGDDSKGYSKLGKSN